MRIKIALICLTGATMAFAQEQEVPLKDYTLRQCIDYAIEHNITVRQSANQVEQNAVAVSTAKWARLPNLNASAGENWNWGRTEVEVLDTSTPDSDDTYRVNQSIYSNGVNLGLSTNVPLFTGFELPNQYALAKLTFQAAVADLDKAKDDIAIQVASSYLQVLLNQELRQVSIDQLTLSQEQADRIIRLYELGKASPSEVADAKARIAQDQITVTQSDNDYQIAMLDLSQLLELQNPKSLSIQNADTTFIMSMLTPPDEIYQQALVSKPEIQASQYRLQGSEKNIRIAQSGYYPTLSLGADMGTYYTSAMKKEYNFGKQLKDNWGQGVSLTLNIPIFNRFATRNSVRTARLRYNAYAMELDLTKKTLYKDIQQAWYRAVASESQYRSSEVAATASQEAFQLMSEKFSNGKATFIEFNEAKFNLAKALSDRIQAKYNYMFTTKILDFYKGQIIE